MEPSKRLLGSGAQTSRVQILVVAVLLVALLLATPVAATQYDLQKYNDLNAAHEDFDGTYYITHPKPVFYLPDLTQGSVNQIGFGPILGGGGNYYIVINSTIHKEEFEEISWWGWNNWVQLFLWDVDKVYIDVIQINPPSYVPSGGWQVTRNTLRRTGTTWEYYVNGVYQGDAGTVVTSAYYFQLFIGVTDTYIIDNIIVGDSEPNIIGGLPLNWYIKRDMITPSLKGVINNTGNAMSTNTFHANWMVDSSGSYTISIENVGTGFVANTTSWTAAADWSRGWAGNNTYTIQDVFIGTSAPYGYYALRLKEGGSTLDSSYFWYLASGATIAWDKDIYGIGDVATITTDVSSGYWDTSTYAYTGKIIDLYGVTQDTWTINSQTMDHTVDLTSYPVGDYYAVIVASSGGTDYYMAFDIATINDKVNILGHTVNAYTGGVVPLASVSFIRGGTFHNSVSSAAGSFSETGLLWGLEIGVNATKTDFNFTPFKFTPPAAGTYTLNLSLLPDYIPNSTAIAGVVYEDWSHNAIPGATVWISNSTWTGTSTTATSMGFYMFDGLAAGESYLINATAAGYAQSVDYSRSPIVGLHIVQNIEMTSSYILTVYIRDATTNSLIMDTVFVESSDGQIKNTTMGSTTFTLGFGAYTITGSSSGYTGSSTAVLMTGNRDITLYLTKTTAQPTKQIYIAPHEVRFVVHDIYGAAIPDVAVTAVGWASSMPDPAGWLLELFGINTATTPTNSTMAGTTGTDGSIVFIMFPAYKYNITFTKAGYNIPIQYIWPKEDQYLITAMPIAQPSTTELNWSLWQVPVGANQVKVGLDYNDTGAATTSLEFYVRDTNKATVYHEQFFSLGWAQPNYTITIGPNQYWYWGFNATNTNFAENITADQYLATETRRVNLPIPDFFQNLMSVAFIVIVMGLSGTENRRQVMVFDSFFGIFLTGIGVFPAMNNVIGWPLLFMALGFSVLYYMRTGERKEGT